MGTVKHMTPDTGQTGQTGVDLSHTPLARGSRTLYALQSRMGLSEQSERAEPVGGSLRSNETVRWPGAPLGGCGWLV